MTGVDLLVTTFLAACVMGSPHHFEDRGERYTVTQYDCPLVATGASFTVIEHLCSGYERHAIAMKDERNGRGFVADRFGMLEPAYVQVDEIPAYFPMCLTHFGQQGEHP